MAAMNQCAMEGRPGMRVLVAEDNFLIGEFVRQILTDMGCSVTGPIGDLNELLEAIRLDLFDGALLDLDLDGVSVLPAANALAEHGTPFIVASGRGNLTGLPALLARAPQLAKPYNAGALEQAVSRTFGSRAPCEAAQAVKSI